MDSQQFLKKPTAKTGPLFVVHGDEAFLKRRVLSAIRQRALADANDDQAVSVHAGDTAEYAIVFDELNTVPFFQPRRVVIVEGADPFVTRYRVQLEKAIQSLPETGVLILEVKTWAATTRLAKMVADSATIACKAPKPYELAAWCSEWAMSQHQKQLPGQAADLLVDLVGADMGLLDQEILKLAIYVGERKRIETEDVDRLVGNNRAENTWKIFDAIAAGQSDKALAMLDRLLEQGDQPLKIMGAFSMQLRRLAQAARLVSHGSSLGSALAQVGVPPFGLKGAEQQVRHLGRRRLGRLYDWLLEVNMGLRGDSPLPERTLLERFLLRLARPLESMPK